ncbi:MAG: response regulator transcription factor [Spirochaetota bacterium]
MLKLLIVDDHSIVREGLMRIFLGWHGIESISEASSGLEAIDMVRTMDFNLVILDIGMAGRGGLEVLVSLKAIKPNLSIIVFSMYPAEQYAIRCFKSGASAYISKESHPTELLKAVEAVTAGRNYVTESIGAQMADIIRKDSIGSRHEKLSDRELQIIIGIGAGKSNVKIAEELFLSPKTVSTYKTRILAKMGMETTSQLMKYVLQEGLAS